MNNNEKPKYKKLKDRIIEDIESQQMKAGEKIYSENQLAEKFNVSRQTVRQAIGDLVGEGWLYRKQGRGTFVNYRPEKKAGAPKTIAVMTTYLDDYIFPSIIRGIDSVLSQNGYNITICCTLNMHEKERECLKNLLAMKIEGLIVEPTRSALPNPNGELYREFGKRGIPLLFIHGCCKGFDYPYIVEDDVQGGYIGTNYLIGLGHKKIGGVFKIDDMQGHYRFEGYEKAHKENGLNVTDSRVLWFDTDDMALKLKGKGNKKLVDILKKCSAVICYNDMVSVMVMDVIRDLGMSVPDDISIVSFDDSQLAVASEIKLTSIAHPKEKLGRQAAKTMIDMVEKKIADCSLKIKPEFIVRGGVKNLL